MPEQRGKTVVEDKANAGMAARERSRVDAMMEYADLEPAEQNLENNRDECAYREGERPRESVSPTTVKEQCRANSQESWTDDSYIPEIGKEC